MSKKPIGGNGNAKSAENDWNLQEDEAGDNLEYIEGDHSSESDEQSILSAFDAQLTGRRRKRLRNLLVRFMVIVLLPTTLFAIYLYGFATDRYVSSFQITVHAPQSGGTQSIFESFIGGGTINTNTQAYVLESYIPSEAMLNELDQKLNLRQHYSQDFIDSFSRLSPGADNATFLEYFQGLLSVELDAVSFIISVSTQAFDPEYAYKVATMIAQKCENLINHMTEQSRKDSLLFANRELKLGEEKLRKARLTLKGFRDKYGEIDPVQSASGFGSIVMSLQSQLSQAQTELSQLKSFMQENSIEIRNQRTKIRSLQDQIRQERMKLGSEEDSEELYSNILAEFEALKIDEEFAKQSYEAALRMLEGARAEINQKQAYVIAFIPATKPDISTEPRRAYLVLTVFLGAFVFNLIGGFIISAIREHLYG